MINYFLNMGKTGILISFIAAVSVFLGGEAFAQTQTGAIAGTETASPATTGITAPEQPTTQTVLSAAPQEAATEADISEIEEGEDSEADIFISSGIQHAPEPVNLGGNGVITLLRQESGEKVTAAYRRADGSYDTDELEKLNALMRCSLTGKDTMMAVKLIELLDAVEDKFGKRGLVLLSGYRTPKLNRTIAGAAEHSFHMMGWAADIRIPGYSAAKIKNFARKMNVGGVGYYQSMGFTHLDVGPSRYWMVKRRVRRYSKKRRRAKNSSAYVAARHTSSRTALAARKSSSATKVARAPAKKNSSPKTASSGFQRTQLAALPGSSGGKME